MSIVEFLLLMLVAGICGGIAQAIAGFSRGGCLVAVALGLIGALLGTWLARQFGLPDLFSVDIDGKQFPIVWSIIGATLFAAVVSLISGRSRRPRA